MSYVNQKKQSTVIKSHKNWMGGTSYDVNNPLTKLRMAAASSFFGEPMYYHSSGKKNNKISTSSKLKESDLNYLRKTLDAVDPVSWRLLSPAQLMESAIDDALNYDVEETLKLAASLRHEDLIRVTPQVILVRAANHPRQKGTGLVRHYASSILLRTDDAVNGLAYQLSAFGKPIPNCLKRAWSDFLSNRSEYSLAKYRMEGREVKLVDLVNLTHPFNQGIDKLMTGDLKLDGETWESIISSKGSNLQSWQEALNVMGHMALLRNLRNLNKAGVKTSEFANKLKNGVKDGKQLPFRYYSAYQNVEDSGIRDLLAECLDLSMENAPYFEGRTISLADNSGSAQGTATSEMGSMRVSTIANLTALITGIRSDEGFVGVFGDNLEVRRVRKRDSIFTQLDELEKVARGIGQGTENGIWLFFDRAIRNREHFDNIFIYSDMQAGHGGLYGRSASEYGQYLWRDTHYIDVAALIKTYRNQVNKDVNVFLVQVAGYQDTLVPEFYNKTYILGGWGTGILNFAKALQ